MAGMTLAANEMSTMNMVAQTRVMRSRDYFVDEAGCCAAESEGEGCNKARCDADERAKGRSKLIRGEWCS